MLRVRFQPTIPVFEQKKAFTALDRTDRIQNKTQ
jgi:hypothetical protein